MHENYETIIISTLTGVHSPNVSHSQLKYSRNFLLHSQLHKFEGRRNTSQNKTKRENKTNLFISVWLALQGSCVISSFVAEKQA